MMRLSVLCRSRQIFAGHMQIITSRFFNGLRTNDRDSFFWQSRPTDSWPRPIILRVDHIIFAYSIVFGFEEILSASLEPYLWTLWTLWIFMILMFTNQVQFYKNFLPAKRYSLNKYSSQITSRICRFFWTLILNFICELYLPIQLKIRIRKPADIYRISNLGSGQIIK